MEAVAIEIPSLESLPSLASIHSRKPVNSRSFLLLGWTGLLSQLGRSPLAPLLTQGDGLESTHMGEDGVCWGLSYAPLNSYVDSPVWLYLETGLLKVK